MKGALLMLFVSSICFIRASSSRCPHIAVKQNFTVKEYVGTWYEIQRLHTAFVKGKCVAQRYTLQVDGWMKMVTQKMLPNGTLIAYEGDIAPASVNETAKLQFRAFKLGHPAMSLQDILEFSFNPYWIIATDYRNYSLVYSCWNAGLRLQEYAWILSRERHLHENTTNYLRDILSDINIKKMIISDQDGCPSQA
uniref:apolipoprotein D-like n=1 Tax=Pristiophorus japonicus TaxID=55135 RepID=UPI00398ECB7E